MLSFLEAGLACRISSTGKADGSPCHGWNPQPATAVSREGAETEVGAAAGDAHMCEGDELTLGSFDAGCGVPIKVDSVDVAGNAIVTHRMAEAQHRVVCIEREQVGLDSSAVDGAQRFHRTHG